MTDRNPSISMSDWQLSLRREPVVRIGVILEEDAFDAVHLRVPDQPHYELAGVGSEPLPLAPQTTLEVRRSESALTIHIGDQTHNSAGPLRISTREPVPLEPNAGVLVRDVVAGRGFHWQKPIDQRLAGTLELRPAPGGIILINELPLEDYLAGVITAEMSSACPLSLLQAQCVVARSWLLAMTEPKHVDQPFDRCNDDCCQRYQGTSDLNQTALDAARSTRGQVLLAPTGVVLDANYAKSCGGVSELAEHVWGHPKPGISAVVDAPPRELEARFLPVTERNLDDYLDGRWVQFTQAYCSPNIVSVGAIGRYLGRVDTTDNYFRWTIKYSRAELEELLRGKLPEAHNLAELTGLGVDARGVSGRASKAHVNWIDTSGTPHTTTLASEYRIREVLHRKFLYSSAFAVRPEHESPGGRLISITLRGAGWGHGVGLCQIGALGMGLCGIDYESICRHYYPEASLTGVYE